MVNCANAHRSRRRLNCSQSRWSGDTALYSATGSGRIPLVRMLLTAGADFEDSLRMVRVRLRLWNYVNSPEYAKWSEMNALFNSFLAAHYLLRTKLYVVGPRSENPASARHQLFGGHCLAQSIVSFLAGDGRVVEDPSSSDGDY